MDILVVLETTVRPPQRIKLGSLLSAIARQAGGLTEAAYFDQLRDRKPADPMELK